MARVALRVAIAAVTAVFVLPAPRVDAAPQPVSIPRADGNLAVSFTGFTWGLGTTAPTFQRFVWGGSGVLTMPAAVTTVSCIGGLSSSGWVPEEHSLGAFPLDCSGSSPLDSATLNCSLHFTRVAAAVAVTGMCSLSTPARTYTTLMATGALAWAPTQVPPVTRYSLVGSISLVDV